MKISLIPSAVSGGDGGRGYFLSSYLIDDVVAIDAGGLGFLGELKTQFRVKDVFVTHCHMDHIASLPIFLETVFEVPGGCITVHGSQASLDCLRRDVFNNRVWPDFVALSENGLPFVKLNVLEPGRTVTVGNLRLTPIEVNHVVPTFGFLVSGANGTVAIPSDTGPTEAFWQKAAAVEDLKAVFLEASFPDSMRDLAVISKHLTPATFAVEAAKLGRDVPFIAVHIKPRYYNEVVAELESLGFPHPRIGVPGISYEF